MSLYAEYVKEREGFETVEAVQGFATYKIFDKECYIRDLYVIPQYRKTQLASSIANIIAAIAKTKGCTILTGSVAKLDPNKEQNIEVLKRYGMKQFNENEEIYMFSKEIL